MFAHIPRPLQGHRRPRSANPPARTNPQAQTQPDRACSASPPARSHQAQAARSGRYRSFDDFLEEMDVARRMQDQDLAALDARLAAAPEPPHDVSMLPGLLGAPNGYSTADRDGIQRRYERAPKAQKILFANAYSEGALKGFNQTGFFKRAAFYAPENHTINLRADSDRSNPRGAYSTLFHESGHFVDNAAAEKAHFLKAQADAISAYRQLEQDNTAQLAAAAQARDMDLMRDCAAAQMHAQEMLRQIYAKRPFDAQAPDFWQDGTWGLDLSADSEESVNYHQAIDADYRHYRDKYLAAAKGQTQTGRDEALVNEMLMRRIYFGKVRCAELEAQRPANQRDLRYGTPEEAKRAADAMLAEWQNKPLEERRTFLDEYDPLNKQTKLPVAADRSNGVQDLFGIMADRENRCDIRDRFKWGHGRDYNTTAAAAIGDSHAVFGPRVLLNEAWAHMTEASMSDDPAKLLYMEEFLPNSFHVFRRASAKAALDRLKVH